jgi:hypothetical protein
MTNPTIIHRTPLLILTFLLIANVTNGKIQKIPTTNLVPTPSQSPSDPHDRKLQVFNPSIEFKQPPLTPVHNVTNLLAAQKAALLPPGKIEPIEKGYRTLNIYGNYSIGYYFAPIFIGESHDRKDLILDTGSSLTTFPCSNCASCGRHWNKPYQINDSKSFEFVKCNKEYFGWQCRSCQGDLCHYVLNYVEGSGYAGDYSMDYV